MCANYKPTTPEETAAFFESLDLSFEYKSETWPGYDAPVLIGVEGRAGELQPVRAMFGLVPAWAKDTKISRQTYNARSETIAEKPSYKHAWKHRQFCLVPVQHFYEPNYESGKPVRWAIRRRDEKPFAIAAIMETNRQIGAEPMRSFSMITINAIDHPLMKHFHALDDEKRSIVVVDPDGYQDWLAGGTEAEVRARLKPFDAAEYVGEPAPRPKKAA